MWPAEPRDRARERRVSRRRRAFRSVPERRVHVSIVLRPALPRLPRPVLGHLLAVCRARPAELPGRSTKHRRRFAFSHSTPLTRAANSNLSPRAVIPHPRSPAAFRRSNSFRASCPLVSSTARVVRSPPAGSAIRRSGSSVRSFPSCCRFGRRSRSRGATGSRVAPGHKPFPLRIRTPRVDAETSKPWRLPPLPLSRWDDNGIPPAIARGATESAKPARNSMKNSLDRLVIEETSSKTFDTNRYYGHTVHPTPSGNLALSGSFSDSRNVAARNPARAHHHEPEQVRVR